MAVFFSEKDPKCQNYLSSTPLAFINPMVFLWRGVCSMTFVFFLSFSKTVEFARYYLTVIIKQLIIRSSYVDANGATTNIRTKDYQQGCSEWRKLKVPRLHDHPGKGTNKRCRAEVGLHLESMHFPNNCMVFQPVVTNAFSCLKKIELCAFRTAH